MLIVEATIPSEQKGMYGSAWMRASMKSRQEADLAAQSPRDELQMYLSSPLEDVEDVVAWWGVCLLSF